MTSLQLKFELLSCLCAVTICRAFAQSAYFRLQVIQTTWNTSDAQLLGKLSVLQCALKTVFELDKCDAFYLTQNDGCYLVKSWKEQQPSHSLTVWMKQGAPEKCKASVFPKSFGKSRYYYEEVNRKKWTDAAVFCESRGGKLVQISTDAERKFLWDMINKPTLNTRYYVFVGAYKDQNDGLPHSQGWKWRGSEEPFQSSFWQSAQPNNHGRNQFCAAFVKSDKRVGDVPKTSPQKFICECLTL